MKGPRDDGIYVHGSAEQRRMKAAVVCHHVVLGLSEPILSGKAYAKQFVLAYSGWLSQKQSQ